jgi:uncharacterized membrane protein
VWLALQCAVIFVILFDVPLARPILVGFYVSLIPGMLLLHLLRPQLTTTEFLLFSVGLSIAVLMFIGVGMNTIAQAFAIPGLTQNRLLVAVIMVTSTLLGISYLEGGTLPLPARSRFRTNPSYLLLFTLPMLSIAGAVTNNITLMLVTIVLIAVLYLVSGSSQSLFPARSYPVILLIIAVTLLLHTTLVSENLMGYDIHLEYQVFKLTEAETVWAPSQTLDPSQIANYQSTLSITILPTILAQLLNLNGEVIFKVVYPLLYTIVPLALYSLYTRRVTSRIAFLATLFVMASPITFYGIENLSLARQMIAEIFLVLSLLLLFDKVSSLPRLIMIILFGMGIIVSHYALAFIYLFYLIFVFLFSWRRHAFTLLNRKVVMIYALLVMLWYVFISRSPTMTLLNVGENIYLSFFDDLFNPGARGWVFPHLVSPLSLASRINQYLYYASQGFIGLGVLQLLRQRRTLDREYLLFSVLSSALLVFTVVIPRLAPSFNFTRFYHVAIIFLAPAFVIGCTSLFGCIEHRVFKAARPRRPLTYGAIALLLSVALLFHTGLVNHVTNSNPTSYPLEIQRIETLDDLAAQLRYDNVYTSEYDALSATWLAIYTDNVTIYGDRIADIHPLLSYGLTPPQNTKVLYNTTIFRLDSYIYLRELNLIDGIIAPSWDARIPSPTAMILPEIQTNVKIYSNGASEVYHVPDNR